MPSTELLESCCRLAKDYNAAIVTQIFQSTNFSAAACRAITSSWIGANLPETVKWKKGITEQLESGHEQFVVAQNLQTDTFRKSSGLEEAQAAVKELEARMDEVLALPEDTLELRVRKAEKGDALAAAGPEIRRKQAEALSRFLAMEASAGARSFAEVFVNPGPGFQALKNNVSQMFSVHGFYYLNVHGQAGGHAFGFYHQPTGECRMLDANTGEWAFEGAASMKYFFKDYVDTIYKGRFDANGTRYTGFACSLSDARHHSAAPCPFATCPFTWTSCSHAAREISRIRGI